MDISLYDQIAFCEHEAIPALYSCTETLNHIKKTMSKYAPADTYASYLECLEKTTIYYKEMVNQQDKLQYVFDRDGKNKPFADFSLADHRGYIKICKDSCSYYEGLSRQYEKENGQSKKGWFGL